MQLGTIHITTAYLGTTELNTMNAYIGELPILDSYVPNV